ncbi:MAG: type II secretion system F family protein, partial [Gammaproteobacteria bacterium]|nr:type II secretion system F family protein [Gammaproteobacteria bacterium]
VKNRQYTFNWEGSDRKGNRIKGEMPGMSIALVRAELRRQGITPIKVNKKAAALFSARKKKIKSRDIAIFSRQLATMVAAGVPLVQAFDIIAKGGENASMQELVLAVKADVESGSSLANAMRRHPSQFDELFCSLVNAGEQAGILDTLLDKVAVYKEKTEMIKSKLRRAMVYPIAVIAIGILVTVILLIKVVPEFQKLFANFGNDLPVATKMVISMSEFVQEWWLLSFIVVAGLSFSFTRARKTSDVFNDRFDQVILTLPLFGGLLRKGVIARYSRTLATMFSAGVPLVEALESVAGAAGNRVYARAIMRMRDGVATGQQLQMTMHQSKLFPNMAVQMVAIGEESGSLDVMLSKVADFYEREVDEGVDSLSKLMEPLIMVILGGLVGGLVIAMYMPIFNMGKVM